MKRLTKTAVCMLTTVALSATMVVLPATVDEAHAAEKPYMKTLKLKWDLKKNKAVKSKEKVVGVGNKALKITVKNYKTTKLKNGKKKTTFTIVYNRNFKLTKKQVHKIVNYYPNGFAGGWYFCITDYATGLSLGNDSTLGKELGVSVKYTDWKYSKYKKYKDSHGCWARYPLASSVKVSMTYPADYTGACLGVGANTYLYQEGSAADRSNQAHFEGKRPFGKTYMYKKGKTNSHWMRIK
ncbi:hypothetical protein [Adlercreutzia caecimuris]|uniref:hypothetical protein n=1 Tax=Adlercreutzia caecimuris TaxID=671266 RepID=UPI0013723893|nr:hypothetical protein [Adlercreutzia caecimuris]NBJ66618.1 hypothetical protein [Adlercreutzia caecimuris]